jgi:alginate O-acetyltransferase complex protein AlgI
VNLGVLCFFKYFNFFLSSASGFLAWVGLPASDWTLKIFLPYGISFYTFQSMSYAIDVYRGHAKPLRSFLDFACFISLFPQLVAGPINRYQDVADQLLNRTHSLAKFSRGIAFFSLGIAKKVLLANPCGRIADTAFDSAFLTVQDAWTGVFAYTFQIYFDFSGYSDMAVGLGLMFGFVFIKNFDSPYLSRSLTEFWQRWHISLSTWLRDYLYIPLGGNRKGDGRTYVNLIMVMVLGGLWHGASWNFAIWGGAHGIWLALERLWTRHFSFRPPAWLQTPLTFLGVSLLWIPFRAADSTTAAHYFRSLWPGTGPDLSLVGAATHTPYLMISLMMAAIIAFFGIQSWYFTRNLRPWKIGVLLALLVIGTVTLSSQSYNPFIYFIF